MTDLISAQRPPRNQADAHSTKPPLSFDPSSIRPGELTPEKMLELLLRVPEGELLSALQADARKNPEDSQDSGYNNPEERLEVCQLIWNNRE